MTKCKCSYKDRIIVALDVNNLASAEQLVDQLKGLIKIFKVGKRLFTSCGPKVINMITEKGNRIFLDLKFHDIPNTVAGAAEAATEQKVFMFNLHASGGLKMMSAAVQAAEQRSAGLGIKRPIVLGVTVLTSSNEEDLRQLGINRSVQEQVVYLAKQAKDAGLDGVVCSAHEIELIRKTAGDDFVIVTPGIRPSWSASNDQKRIMTPAQAFDKGADYIVIGRPIAAAPDPAEATQRIRDELI